MRRILAILPILFTAVILCISCSETKETGDYENWKQRNRDYIAKIASGIGDLTPETASEGESFRILHYALDPEAKWGNGSYVYCQVLKKGNDTVAPCYTDSIRINYRVRLMPTDSYPEGQVVDQSFKTPTLDPAVNIPSSFKVSALIQGVSTALMYMHKGDYWRIYIPYQLGYDNQKKGSIPAYSTLVYEINLTEISKTGRMLPPR